jgi:hypothetical protein
VGKAFVLVVYNFVCNQEHYRWNGAFHPNFGSGEDGTIMYEVFHEVSRHSEHVHPSMHQGINIGVVVFLGGFKVLLISSIPWVGET